MGAQQGRAGNLGVHETDSCPKTGMLVLFNWERETFLKIFLVEGCISSNNDYTTRLFDKIQMLAKKEIK